VYWFRLEKRNIVTEKRGIPDKINPIELGDKTGKYKWLDYFKLRRKFRSVVQEIQPDLIHAGPIQHVAFLPALIGYHPLLTMSWGFDLLQDAERDFVWKWVTRFVLKNTDVLLTDCETVQKKAIDFGYANKKKVIFPWGVDLNLFNPARRPFLRRQVGYEDDLLIVHTRSWETRYGVDVALKGFALALQENPHLRMFMLSDGSQRPWVEKFIDKNGLKENILLCGYKENRRLADYYQAADIFLSASHIDGSSVALMEALACGCPALVSDIPSNKEWIEEGIQGWLFKDGDARDLAKKLLDVSSQHSQFSKIRINARKKAERKADWSKNFSKLLQAYDLAIRD